MLQKIFIAGLTAAGKTTHSKLLASEFNLHYVSASNILLRHAKLDTSTHCFTRDLTGG